MEDFRWFWVTESVLGFWLFWTQWHLCVQVGILIKVGKQSVLGVMVTITKENTSVTLQWVISLLMCSDFVTFWVERFLSYHWSVWQVLLESCRKMDKPGFVKPLFLKNLLVFLQWKVKVHFYLKNHEISPILKLKNCKKITKQKFKKVAWQNLVQVFRNVHATLQIVRTSGLSKKLPKKWYPNWPLWLVTMATVANSENF